MNLAPIVLFVYSRPWHTRQTLEALAKNDLASESVLYIFADGPKENEAEEIISKIKETRDIIKSKEWCKEVIIYEKDKNWGLANSVISGVTEIVNLHERIIVLEDDIITSEDFLTFMNKALDYYESDEFVAGITGFKYPSNELIQNVHFLPIGSSWGWASWQRQWSLIDFDTNKLISKVKLVKNKFDFGCFPFFKMLEDQVAKKIDSWAIRFYASFFLQHKCFVFPASSLVENIGFNLEGTHTKISDGFMDKVKASKHEIILTKAVFNIDTSILEKSFEKQYCVDKRVIKKNIFQNMALIKNFFNKKAKSL